MVVLEKRALADLSILQWAYVLKGGVTVTAVNSKGEHYIDTVVRFQSYLDSVHDTNTRR